MVTMQISREWRSRVIKRGCLFCLMVGWLGWGALLGESPSSVRGESPAPESTREVEWSLQPPAILSPVDESHARNTRGSQGVAGIERSPQGRLWATWYAGTGTRGYDHQRYTRNRAGDEGIGSVQMAIFREEDIRAGKTVSPRTRLQQEISRLAP